MTEHSELITLIREESVGIVAETIDFWLYECSISEAPSSEEVKQWQTILSQRGGKFTRLANICSQWLAEEEQHHEQ